MQRIGWIGILMVVSAGCGNVDDDGRAVPDGYNGDPLSYMKSHGLLIETDGSGADRTQKTAEFVIKNGGAIGSIISNTGLNPADWLCVLSTVYGDFSSISEVSSAIVITGGGDRWYVLKNG